MADFSNNRVRTISSLGVVTTLAGSATLGQADGTGTSASFNKPSGVAVSTNGVIYIADHYNHKIRAMSSVGVVTTFVGTGLAGISDGIGAAATLSYPVDLVMDTSGNMYTCSTNNFARVRKITPAGVTTTFAGSKTVNGYVDGTGTSAQFAATTLYCGLAVDTVGNVYVADSNNDVIRKITSSSVVTTLVGLGAGYNDGTGTSAKFNNPLSVAVDTTGNVYVADFSNMVIRLVTSSGVVTTFAGNRGGTLADGSGDAVWFYYPSSVRVDSSMNVYVGQYNYFTVRKISQAGEQIQSIFLSITHACATQRSFFFPVLFSQNRCRLFILLTFLRTQERVWRGRWSLGPLVRMFRLVNKIVFMSECFIVFMWSLSILT